MPIENCTKCLGGFVGEQVAMRCLPVPCFGNPERSKVQVATIGLNPSIGEFRNNDGTIRPEAERLPMLFDFGATEREELDGDAMQRAKDKRDHYFSNQPHPWFTPLQLLMRGMNLGWSYAEGTAVHIDVVSCSTDDAWSGLKMEVQSQLIANCQEYFIETVSKLPDRTWLIINGRSAFLGLKAGFSLEANTKFSDRLPKNRGVEIFVGLVAVGDKRLRYFGWSANLHRSSVTDMAEIIEFWNSLPASIKS